MIDLRSDTVTKPTQEMRDAARNADVGDDVHGEDPTVNALQERAAAIVGKEAALFVPSGTMGNQVAIMAQTTPGQEVIVEQRSHILNWEVGGLATNAGVNARSIDGGTNGLFSPEQVRDNLYPPSSHNVGTGLVCVENTHNYAGGVAYHPDDIAALREPLADLEIPVHIDGARLFNAAVALELPPAELAAPAETVMFCLSKGLGAPVGSIVAGPESVIDTARLARKRLGGGMRQIGIIGAPGLVALENWERLEADHRRASKLADGLADIDGVSVNDPETNIVLLDIAASSMSVSTFLEACEERGVRGIQFDDTIVRFCTHIGIDDSDVEHAIDCVDSVLSS